ncbi:MAG: hypothetical protein ACN6PH_17895 [Pseudomonas sp.]|jgi:hypothetical protein|uniref:hypothetical protein n=1 Tax=Pseudomonadaceae TaxID=135621 RepID=UPI0021F468E3|nr:hypothetical protein [Pseudomonas sp. Z8(2022)]UYP31794.1 hypothetical protein OEG79_06775 [Pseudomonas sp. Z8(2022)]
MDLEKAFKEISPQDNEANQVNPNKGTSGTNRQYDQAQGNRGKQLNPNQHPIAHAHDEDIDEGDVFWHDNSD